MEREDEGIVVLVSSIRVSSNSAYQSTTEVGNPYGRCVDLEVFLGQ
jgi:hypothetical protein